MLHRILILALCAAAWTALPSQAQPAATTAPAEPAGFNVLEFVVEGNSVLPQIEIERAVYRHMGEGKTFADLEKARTALEKAYQDAGYLTVLVDIPEQQVKGGVVTLQVIEGRVDRLRVTGSRYYSLGEIKSRAPELAEETVPYFPDVQRQLAQLNRNDDRRVTPVLKAGTTPGKVDIELKVEDKPPFHGDFELNNRASANTEPLRFTATLRHDNLWQKDHSLSLSYQTSPENTTQVNVFSGTYVIPGIRGDNALAIYTVNSNSSVAAVGTLNVIGKTKISGLRYIMPLPALDGLSHSLTLGIDYKESRDRVNLTGGASTETPLSYTPLSMQYGLTLRDTGGVTQIDTGANAGLRNFGGNKDSEFANKRFSASASFVALKAGLSRQQNLGGPWSLFAKLDGQAASGPLISNEQYFAGGADSVHVYRESEVLGDVGARGALELRYALPAGDGGVLNDSHVFAFAEGATVKIYDPLPQQQQRFHVSSAGLGLRLKAWRSVRVWLDMGKAFKDTLYTPRGTVRTMFRLGYEF